MRTSVRPRALALQRRERQPGALLGCRPRWSR